jgi:hypothetical protein
LIAIKRIKNSNRLHEFLARITRIKKHELKTRITRIFKVRITRITLIPLIYNDQYLNEGLLIRAIRA